MNACWIGCSAPSAASPSIVVTSAPSACAASSEQELTAAPSSSTVHAPQMPLLQYAFVPVSPRSSRTRSSSVREGGTSRRSRLPLTLSSMSMVCR